MTNHRFHEAFLRQANQFEKIAKMLKATAKTEPDRIMAEVAEGMVRTCEVLAEISLERR